MISARTRPRGSFFRNLVRTVLQHAVHAMTFVITSHISALDSAICFIGTRLSSPHICIAKGAACFSLQRKADAS
ncbi:hypothetical protein WJX79_002599 [Trebouxia sp. C0005]